MIKRLDMFTVLLALVLWVLPILPAQASSLPSKAFVSGLVGHAQSYSLSCESRSASDWAAFWGVNISEAEFLDSLPRSDNPEKGFVGNPNDDWGYTPPFSYGVHADPVAKLLREYGLDARAEKGLSWQEIQREIAAGRPAIVWLIGSVWSGNAKEYQPTEGDPVIVAAFEHTMILVGYDEENVHLIDAFTGLVVTHTIENFLASWSVLSNMAITGAGLLDENQVSSEVQQASGTAETYTVQSGDTLAKLAAQWGTNWQAIANANQINFPYLIFPGQELSADIQEQSESNNSVHEGQIHVVAEGEHLMQIARDWDIDWEALANHNDIEAPYFLLPGDILYLPSEMEGSPSINPADMPASYTATRSESLYAIAHRFEVDWIYLASINNIRFPYIVSTGQSIIFE